MSNPNDTTDKVFPPPENPNPDAPIPIGPSLRVEFVRHRQHLDREFAAIRQDVAAALARLSPAAKHPETIGQRVKNGALAGMRYGAVAMAAGELGAALAKATGHPEVEGPLRVFLNLLGGS
jgi:hypothetical protein